MKKNKLRMGMLLVVLPVCLLLCSAAVLYSDSPVDLGRVYAVSTAKSMAEVEGLIGEPDFVGARTDTGTPTWTYSHPLKYYAFRVDFADDGTVIRCVFDD